MIKSIRLLFVCDKRTNTHTHTQNVRLTRTKLECKRRALNENAEYGRVVVWAVLKLYVSHRIAFSYNIAITIL